MSRGIKYLRVDMFGAGGGARQALSFVFDHDDFCRHRSQNSQHHRLAGNLTHHIVVEI